MKFFIIPFWFHPIEEHFLVCCVFSLFFIFSHCQIYLKNTPEYTPPVLSFPLILSRNFYMIILHHIELVVYRYCGRARRHVLYSLLEM